MRIVAKRLVADTEVLMDLTILVLEVIAQFGKPLGAGLRDFLERWFVDVLRKPMEATKWPVLAVFE